MEHSTSGQEDKEKEGARCGVRWIDAEGSKRYRDRTQRRRSCWQKGAGAWLHPAAASAARQQTRPKPAAAGSPPHHARSDPPPPSFHSDRKQTRTAQCSSHKSPPRTHMPSARCSITATTRHAQEEMVRRQTAIRVGQSIRMSASSSSCSTTSSTKHRKSSLPDCYYLNKSLTAGSLQLDFRG